MDFVSLYTIKIRYSEVCRVVEGRELKGSTGGSESKRGVTMCKRLQSAHIAASRAVKTPCRMSAETCSVLKVKSYSVGQVLETPEYGKEIKTEGCVPPPIGVGL